MLVQNLPSGGYGYTFDGINVSPMKYGQILEYLDNIPNDPIEKFYFDYCLLKADDPNIDNLLVPDFEFVRFYKKAITVNKNCEYTTTLVCPDCGTKFYHKIHLTDIKFSSLDKSIIEGCCIKLGEREYNVKLPTIAEFFKVFNNYRRYKKTTDMKLIKLIAMFEDAVKYPNQFESLVIDAQYDDVVALTMLYDLYYELLEPIVVYCPKCNDGIEDPSKMRGMAVEIDSLTADFFRDLIVNNRVDRQKVLFGKVRRTV